LPLLLLLSFWIFRGFVAALLPPLVGFMTIAGALLGLRRERDDVALDLRAQLRHRPRTSASPSTGASSSSRATARSCAPRPAPRRCARRCGRPATRCCSAL
jgi:hypothetical protein